MTLMLRSESSSPDRTTLWVQGRLDAMTFGQFDDLMLTTLPRVADGGTLVIDLSELEYVSSAGLRSFARVRRSMRARGGNTLLLNPQPQVRKVFDIVKAVPVNEVFASIAELDGYLDHIQRQIVEGTKKEP
jgi:sigma-B regulation protein RsbU (phosphoserine phosphatase)